MKLSIDVESIQFVSPNVAVEHGTAPFVTPEAEPEEVAYSAVYVRRAVEWLLDRVTDKEALANQSQLRAAEGTRVVHRQLGRSRREFDIVTDCNWTKNKNFMVRSFTVSADDNIDLSGMQIIGWDAGSKQIRSWTFDSDGGFAQGVWSKSKDRWYVHKKGTTADGETTTAVNHVNTDR